MKQIHQYEEVLSFLNKNDKALVYVMTTDCSVCHADYPKVASIVKETDIPAIYFLADKLPEAAGQLSLFTSPVVILYKSEREYHRQARIIDFDTLRLRIDQLIQE
ncbi:thioredoxin family protein [Macrococcus armenti]|uniref:thioredoxin family protein n=1 Tax=Macrococcus armenti TaxID=2875764 RepID=UPI001CD02D86|nr:thioredoxin family protein [Macrococcus armenti]UBH13186.1 thioredoxin family protein [Macrococcus armenti]UBH22436.1 thioredoxin family protein [Macrococcus armenti]